MYGYRSYRSSQQTAVNQITEEIFREPFLYPFELDEYPLHMFLSTSDLFQYLDTRLDITVISHIVCDIVRRVHISEETVRIVYLHSRLPYELTLLQHGPRVLLVVPVW